MTAAGRPVPGPPAARPAPLGAPDGEQRVALADRLHGLPVSEHAGVLAAEHGRLQRQLATIDQL